MSINNSVLSMPIDMWENNKSIFASPAIQSNVGVILEERAPLEAKNALSNIVLGVGIVICSIGMGLILFLTMPILWVLGTFAWVVAVFLSAYGILRDD